ncbi:MAG: PhoH family protein [Spirochaetes bacterium]|nr:PhoH family protein [Spirochaetota bacterium]
MTEIIFEIDDMSLLKKLCGLNENNLKIIEQEFSVRLIARGSSIKISGDEKNTASVNNLFHVLSDYLHDKSHDFEFDKFDLRYLIQQAHSGNNLASADIEKIKVFIPESRKTIYPKSMNQAHYISQISKKSVVFGIGPAGTGKTYLAVACALREFYNNSINRIVLTRPAVEAGESLGYLPGDFMQKVNPYLRPLYDALFDLTSYEKVSKMIENNLIEIAPLAYMRGRTLNNAFVILDEAQNTTSSQMKMFLTRLGSNSKMVISGDATQIDIDKPHTSGLLHAEKILKNIDEISFVKFNQSDICRHPVVEKIVSAYDKAGS